MTIGNFKDLFSSSIYLFYYVMFSSMGSYCRRTTRSAAADSVMSIADTAVGGHILRPRRPTAAKNKRYLYYETRHL